MNTTNKVYFVERAATTRGRYDWKMVGKPFSTFEAARGLMKECIVEERRKRPDPNDANDSFNAESAVKFTGLKEILFDGDTLFRINAIETNA